jgi:hypothetical protein
MKCGLCTWSEKPDSLMGVKKHAESQHAREDVFVVWRNGEFHITKETTENEKTYDADIVKYEIAKEPPIFVPVVKKPTAG